MLVCFPESYFFFYKFWIVDSGASRHICSNTNAFISLRPIQNSTITLLNKTCIPVHFSGDVKLSSNLILKDALFVPQFQFNLLSISALTPTSLFIVNFFSIILWFKIPSIRRLLARVIEVKISIFLMWTNYPCCIRTIHYKQVGPQHLLIKFSSSLAS